MGRGKKEEGTLRESGWLVTPMKTRVPRIAQRMALVPDSFLVPILRKPN